MYDNNKYIFLHTLDDIRSKMSGERYDMIRACGLLRHLFLDANPLVHLINEQYKLPIIFHVPPPRPALPEGIPNPLLRWYSLEPVTAITCKIKLAEFLKTTVCLYKDQNFCVQDVITITAHLMGGIHSQKPRADKEHLYLELGEYKLPEFKYSD